MRSMFGKSEIIVGFDLPETVRLATLAFSMGGRGGINTQSKN
jgi:hypothetical protein